MCNCGNTQEQGVKTKLLGLLSFKTVTKLLRTCDNSSWTKRVEVQFSVEFPDVATPIVVLVNSDHFTPVGLGVEWVPGTECVTEQGSEWGQA